MALIQFEGLADKDGKYKVVRVETDMVKFADVSIYDIQNNTFVNFNEGLELFFQIWRGDKNDNRNSLLKTLLGEFDHAVLVNLYSRVGLEG